MYVLKFEYLKFIGYMISNIGYMKFLEEILGILMRFPVNQFERNNTLMVFVTARKIN